jgi:phosphoglycolate phosphatase-like HAD superfamily hydrolase
MKIKRLPKIDPRSTDVWLDLEGVLMEKNVSYYLLQYKPLLVLKGVLNGLSRAIYKKLKDFKSNLNQELIKECKKYYERRMAPNERYLLGKLIYKAQKNQQKVLDVLKILKEDGYSVYVVTHVNRETANGFLSCFPKEIRPPFESLVTVFDEVYGEKTNASIVKQLKKNGRKIMGLGDTELCEEALKNSDIPCVIRNGFDKILPCNIEKGFEFKDLDEFKIFLDMIHYDRLLNNLNTES